MKLFPGCDAFLWSSMTANNCNTFLIQGEQKILIDPGHQAHFSHVEAGLRDIGLTIDDVDVVLCTHCHPDHLEAALQFKETKALLAYHQEEWTFIQTMGKQLESLFGFSVNDMAPDFFLKEGDLRLSDVELAVYHSPGHSPGSVCFHWPAQNVLFSGDLIFNGGLGRTDLPGGNGSQLKHSIRRMQSLNLEWILPGHGDPVSGKSSIQRNFEQLENVWFQYI